MKQFACRVRMAPSLLSFWKTFKNHAFSLGFWGKAYKLIWIIQIKGIVQVAKNTATQIKCWIVVFNRRAASGNFLKQVRCRCGSIIEAWVFVPWRTKQITLLSSPSCQYTRQAQTLVTRLLLYVLWLIICCLRLRWFVIANSWNANLLDEAPQPLTQKNERNVYHSWKLCKHLVQMFQLEVDVHLPFIKNSFSRFKAHKGKNTFKANSSEETIEYSIAYTGIAKVRFTLTLFSIILLQRNLISKA